MLHDAHAAGVASPGDHAHVSDLELDGVDRLSRLQVHLDGVVNLRNGVGPTTAGGETKKSQRFVSNITAFANCCDSATQTNAQATKLSSYRSHRDACSQVETTPETIS